MQYFRKGIENDFNFVECCLKRLVSTRCTPKILQRNDAFKFYLRDASAKTETPIMLFVRAGKSEKGHRTTIKVPTGLKILPKNWNPKTHSPRRISDESLINKRLNDIASVANKTWTTLVSEQVEISLTTFQTILKENLKDLIIPGTIQKVNSGLFDDMNKFIDILHSDHSTSTIAKYKNFRRHLMEFSRVYL